MTGRSTRSRTDGDKADPEARQGAGVTVPAPVDSVDAELDEALEETFPASDPIALRTPVDGGK